MVSTTAQPAAREISGLPDELRAWQARMSYTGQQAADELGINRVSYAKMLAGGSIDRRTALACAAIEAGIEPLGAESGR